MKNTKKTGDLGEKIAAEFLESKGYTILEVNYWKKYGEIDIIAQEGLMIHFVEVKTVSYETRGKLETAILSGDWRPEEQVTKRKLHQIEKALKAWISEESYMGEYVVDILAVRIVPRETYATVNFIENETEF